LVPNEDSDNETRAAARLQDFISLMEDGQAYVRDFEAIKATASDGAETTDGTEDHAAYDWTALVEQLERAKYNVWDDLSPSLRQEASILQTVMESLRDCESTSENAMGGGDATTMAVVPLWTSSVIRQAWKAVCDKHQKRLVTPNNNMSSEESATATSALHLIWPPKHKHGGAAGATTVDSIFDVVRLIQDICATPNSSRTHNGPQGWRRLSKASLPHASTETWHVLYMYFICEVARQDWSRRRRSLQMVSSTLSTEQAASELASLDHWNEFVLARVDGDLYESRAGQAAMFLYALDWFMEVDDCQPAAASLPQRPADLTMSTVLKQDFGPSHRKYVEQLYRDCFWPFYLFVYNVAFC
jgi:hypothetical protein